MELAPRRGETLRRCLFMAEECETRRGSKEGCSHRDGILTRLCQVPREAVKQHNFLHPIPPDSRFLRGRRSSSAPDLPLTHYYSDR